MIGAVRKRLRGRLTYATVVSALSAFIVLAGGAAYAGSHLGKHSVGAKQLKRSAVTVAKIRKSAVSGAKVRNGAVTAAKVRAGSIGGASLNLGSMPFTRVVQETRSAGPTALGADPAVVALQGQTYTQPPGRDDLFFGTATATLPASCEAPRYVTVEAFVDARDPTDAQGLAVARGSAEDAGSGGVTLSVPLAPSGSRFQPQAAVSRTIAVTGRVSCESKPASATLASVTIDVVGTR